MEVHQPKKKFGFQVPVSWQVRLSQTWASFLSHVYKKHEATSHDNFQRPRLLPEEEEEEGEEEGQAKKKKKKKKTPRRRHKPRSKRARSECIEKTFPSLIQTGEISSTHLNLGCFVVIL